MNDNNLIIVVTSEDDPLLKRFPYITQSLLHPHFIEVTDIRFFKNDDNYVFKAVVYIDDMTIVETHNIGTPYTEVFEYVGDERIAYLTTKDFVRNI